MAEAFPKGKKVETDPAKKAEKAIKSKKGSIDPIEPYEFNEGGSVKMKEGGDWRKEIADKITKKYGHVLNSKALRQRINKAVVSEDEFRKGAAKTSARWNPQRIAAMKAHHLERKAKKTGESLSKAHEEDQAYFDQQKADKTKKAIKEGELLSKARERDQEFTDKQDKDKREEALTMKRELQKRRSGKDLAPEVKEVKKEEGWWGKMPGKDKAGIAMGIGKGLLSARQKYLEAKQKRKEAIAKGESEAAKTRAAAGRQLIAAPVSLRKGGRVSFKDVLKAKKKMGY
jgi:hypothetical protein